MIVTEPFKLIRNAIDYCKYNTKYLITALLVLIIFQTITEIVTLPPMLLFIYLLVEVILFTGYGLFIIHDIINDGNQLPQFQLKNVMWLGIKGLIVITVYMSIQAIGTSVISTALSFSGFELEDMVLNFTHTIHELLNHNPLYDTIFLVSGIVITYVTVFFMEIGLAMLAEGEPLKNSFSLKLIKEKIDKIGWREYFIEYSIVITSIILLTAIASLLRNFGIVTIMVNFLIFVIEYVAMGMVYKKSTIKK